jgi:hypothetical protein
MAGAIRLGRRDERGGELLVEGKEVFLPVPVAGERLEAVTAFHGAGTVNGS